MPLEYTSGVVKEHTAVRESVGIFDVSHLGKAMVRGPGAAAYVNRTLTNDLGKIRPGKAQYTLCCDDATGGIVDDLIAYYHDDEHVLLVPNAANTAEVVRRLEAAAPDGVADHRPPPRLRRARRPGHRSPTRCSTGSACRPATTTCRSSRREFARRRGRGVPHRLHRRARLRADRPQRRRRSSCGTRCWRPARSTGCSPAGSGARDTLRTEMGYPLHGQDITLDVTPNQARLGWAVGWKKDAFWGRDALLAEKEAGPCSGCCAGWSRSAAASRGPGMMRVADPRRARSARSPPAPSRPTLRKGIGLALVPTLGDRGRRGRRRRPRATRDLPARRSAVRRPVRARVLTWRTFPTSPRPSGHPTPAERPWRWRLENATGAEVDGRATSTPASGSPARPTPSRGSARSGPSWRPRASTRVTLFEGDRQVYGPMSLHA